MWVWAQNFQESTWTRNTTYKPAVWKSGDYCSPFPRRWDSKCWTKCKSKSWMVGRFESTNQNRETEIPQYLVVQIRIEIWLDLNSTVSCNTNSDWDFVLIWICSWLKSPDHSGFRFAFHWPFQVSIFSETGCKMCVNFCWLNFVRMHSDVNFLQCMLTCSLNFFEQAYQTNLYEEVYVQKVQVNKR